MEERITVSYWSSLESLEELGEQARKKYSEFVVSLRKMYDDAFEAAQEDYSAAAEYLSNTKDNIAKYAQRKSVKDYEATMKKLESAKAKAVKNLKATKERYLEIKQRLETFDKEVADQLQTDYETLKERAEDALNIINVYTEKIPSTISEQNQSIFKKMNSMKDRAFQDFTAAEKSLSFMKDRLSKVGKDAIESIQQKYQNLKEEL